MDLVTWIRAKLADVCGFYFMEQASTSPTQDDYLQGHPAKPPDKPARLHARRMWPFGFRSIIPRGVECVTVSPMGSSTQKVIVGAESPAYGPTDLAEGEVVIYNSQHSQGAVCVIRLDAAGNITVIPKATAKVQLGDNNGANLDPVALYTQLKSDFDAFVTQYNSHNHPTAPMGPVSTPDAAHLATKLSTSVQSSNVVAKK